MLCLLRSGVGVGSGQGSEKVMGRVGAEYSDANNRSKLL